MANLYEINEQILNCIDIETGEIIDTEQFDVLQIDRNDKLENIALWYKNLSSAANQFKIEKDLFADRQKRAEKKAESLKAYLDTALKGNKFSTVKVDISYRKSTSVDILSLDKLPVEYKNQVVTISADKLKLAKALKSGIVIDGAEIVESNHIQIK